jgi:fructose-1,6-bisphosphatase/inositol monophosphatase family enzyme
MLSRVAAIVGNTAEFEVMPMFRKLRPEDIAAKETPGDPDDIVTVTDKAAERYLVEQLSGVVPDAVFVGEEAVSANPTLVAALSGAAPAWLIDPIDGTKNFAHGNPNFGIMLALVQNGLTRASWMAMPALGSVVTAASGQGTWLNDARVDTSQRDSARLRGTVHVRLLPADTVAHLRRRLEHRYDPLPSTGSAATEYTDILRGEKDFVIYYRLLPWDHAAGALAIVEAGGAAVHLDGRAYSPRSNDQVTIFAATPGIASTIRELIS